MQKAKRCPNCGQPKVLASRQAKFAPKVDGKSVCVDCAVMAMITKARESL